MSDSIHTLPPTPPALVHSPAEQLDAEPPSLPFEIRGWRWLKPAGYIFFLLCLNLVIPLVIFYSLRSPSVHLSQREVIGYSSISFGLSSCFDAPFRAYRLVCKQDTYAPLRATHRYWHLDSFMWLYSAALGMFTIPLVVGIALPLYGLFLFSTALLIAPFVVVFFLSLLLAHLNVRTPIGLSSDPKGSPIRPAIYYLLEDVVAVDWGWGREWRAAWGRRYEASPRFRAMVWRQTVYWMIWGAIYVAVTSVVAWVAGLTFAFGWVLGQFFLVALIAGVGSWWIVRRELRIERREWVNDRAGGGAGLIEKRRSRRGRKSETIVV